MTQPEVKRHRWPARAFAVAYVVVAFGGTALLLSAVGAHAISGLAPLLWLLYLGPVGILAAVVAVVSGLLLPVQSPSPLASAAIGTLLFTGVACLNVLAVQRLHRSDERDAVSTGQPAQHRRVTALILAFAGGMFVVLTLLAGYFFLAAYGITIPTPDPLRIQLQTTAALGWFAGLAATVGGLVLWGRASRKGRPALHWAGADLAVVATATALVLLSGATAPT